MLSAIDYLISAQHEKGGWGYFTGQRPVVESTAAVLLAIRDESHANDSFQKGIKWLLSSQNEDGGWGIHEDDLESGWQTAWATIVLRHTNQNDEAISKAIEWLTYVATSEVTNEDFHQSRIPAIDKFTAIIWPWLPGQVGWTEPTALAVLALEGITKSQVATTRINAALAYFKHYRTPSGGWEIGNAGPLDTIVIPRAFPTTLVLMALGQSAKEDIQAIDLSALQEDMQRDQGTLAQSAGLLAMKILEEDRETVDSSINKNQLSNGSWENNPFVTAWAMMALRGYL